MTESLFDPSSVTGADAGEERWTDCSEQTLLLELQRRKEALEGQNPLRDPEAYMDGFRAVVALEAHLRDREGGADVG